MSEMTGESLIRLMVGRELETVFPKRNHFPDECILDVRHVGRAEVFMMSHLPCAAVKCLGMAGLVGSGRTQFAETLFGLSPTDGGTVFLRGQQVHITSPSRAVELGMAYVPEDRRRHGVVMDFPIALTGGPALEVAERAAVDDLGRRARTV